MKPIDCAIQKIRNDIRAELDKHRLFDRLGHVV